MTNSSRILFWSLHDLPQSRRVAAISIMMNEKNAFQGKHKGATEGFVLSLAPKTFETTLYSYLGGKGSDFPGAVAVDRTGNIIVAGDTNTKKFPTTPNAQKRTLTGTVDGFLIKITP